MSASASNLRPLPLKLQPEDPAAWLAEQSEAIRRVTSVEGAGQLVQRPVVEPGAYVDPTAQLIGGVIVRKGCYVGPYAVVRLDEKPTPEPLVLDEGSNLQDGAVVHSTTQHIGRRVIVAHQSIVHGAAIEDGVTIYIQATVDGGGTVVGRGSFLHRGSYVGKAVRISPDRYVAPGQCVLTQAEADGLPPVPDALRAIAAHVLESNDEHVQTHTRAAGLIAR